ncbi:MAG: exodeoxyribonuclease V subunit gamma [Gammaproteobacteria bacterium]
MINVFSSNHVDALLLALGKRLEQPPAGGPLARELIVVERGMDRWLWQQLADKHGIAADLDLQLPAGFIWNTLRKLFDVKAQQSPYEQGALAWRLMTLLEPSQLADPAFATVRHYLAGDDDQRKRFQLARRLAGLFDQYLVYRHGMILGWERGQLAGAGDDEPWQMKLWQRIVAGVGGEHRARLLERFFAAARAGTLDATRLPSRISVFAIPALPPVYVQVLAAMAKHVRVDLYALNPCATFWGDALRPGEQAAAFAQYGEAAALQLAGGNPLLANGGARIQQYFLDLADHDAQQSPDLFIEPARDTLLGRLQHDIFHNVAPTPATADTLDDSVQLHGCYSLLREIEVLHDRLLDFFQRDPTLAPHEVLVLTPDIERAAPYIDAVFGAARGTPRDIPWAIADLARGSEHPLAAALRTLLALPDSRFTASEVLGLLETPAVARRFGRLSASDLDTLRRRVHAAGIRWGLDASDRAARGLPAERDHSWQFGLERLFLGLAMDSGDVLVAGRAPFADIEGSDGIALGKLQAFVDRLAQAKRRLSRAQDAASWRALVSQLLTDFCEPDGASEDQVVEAIDEAAREFLAELRLAGHEGDIPPAVFRDDFAARLAQPATHGGLLRGAVTFAQLTPARSMPFRVICLVGMNHDRFPRRQTPSTFDLVAATPRRGDRSRRADDRHLFLETLLAAGERLYISYADRSLRDSSPQQPSVVVDELVDAIIGPQSDPRARDELRDKLVTRHPLQPFSVRQYDGSDPRLFSHDPDWLPAARMRSDAACGKTQPRPPFCPQPLPAPDEPPTGIRLADLHRCLKHPARWFLQRQLGVWLDAHAEDALEDDEPFALADDFAVNEDWLAAALAGRDPDDHFALLAARGALPQGAFARLDWQQRVEKLAPLVTRLRADAAGWAPLDINLPLPDGRRLTGRLARVNGKRQQLASTAGQPHARLLLQAWIDHLVLCAVRGSNDCELLIETVAGSSLLRAPARPAMELLAELVALYDAAQRQPLRLFPKSGWKLVAAKTPEAGLDAAGKQWRGGYDGKPAAESADRDFAVCFGHEDDPLAHPDFAGLANRVFLPLHSALADGITVEDDA